jgi:DNA mismatch repair protein MutL
METSSLPSESIKPTCSIKALPPSTVKHIGSSQVLVDPSSVVKELVENALDARATAIFVEISANTIDTIQVRDNGHGIAPEDRPLVCRRYCTSKIREFDELKDVGARSLGFRGEAMASVAEMSETLSITTRVDGEPVASLLKFAKSGELKA